MLVYLKLYGGLESSDESGQDPQHLEIPQTSTVAELLEYADVPEDLVKIVLVNGVHAETGQTLREGDAVSVFPPVAGG